MAKKQYEVTKSVHYKLVVYAEDEDGAEEIANNTSMSKWAEWWSDIIDIEETYDDEPRDEYYDEREFEGVAETKGMVTSGAG